MEIKNGAGILLAPKILFEKGLTNVSGCDRIKVQKTKGVRKMKMKLKEIRAYNKMNGVTNINNWYSKDVYNLIKNHKIEIIGKSFGVYGINGVLARDENNQLYTLTVRNSNLFILC